MDTELLALGDDITRHPEIGFEEKRSVQLLTDYLKKHDFDVQMGTPGLKTAFVARYNKTTARPTSASSSSTTRCAERRARFTATSTARRDRSASPPRSRSPSILTARRRRAASTVFGAPGEEMMPPNAKTVMYEPRVFNGMDMLVRSHATSATSRPAAGFGTCCMNIDGVKYTFTGAPAHQLTAWNGRNALTAVIHLFNNIDAIRSNIRPEARIQGVITEGGAAPNVVPDHTVADFYIRYPDEVYLAQLSEMVDNAAQRRGARDGHEGEDRSLRRGSRRHRRRRRSTRSRSPT